MKKFSKLIAVLTMLAVAMTFALAGCTQENGGNAKLNAWAVPTYQNVNVGNTVFVQSVMATDSEGNVLTAAVKVVGPNGEIAVSDQTFVASAEGTYNVVYTVTFNGQQYQKVATFTASASQGGGGQQGGDTPGGDTPSGTTDAILGALQVIAGSESSFAVSGNTVTVKKATTLDDYQSIGWNLSGWTLAKGENVTITIKNNTSGTIAMKYKVVADGQEYYGYPDLSVPAGGSDTYSAYTGSYDNQAPSSVTAIELFIGSTASSGTFTVNASLSGAGGSSQGGGQSGTTDAILGALKVVAGSESSFGVSGNTVTVKRATSVDDYQSVGWNLSGWTLAKGQNVSIKVKNNTTGTLTVKYKVVTAKGEQYGYPDLTIAAGGTDTYTGYTGTENDSAPTAVTAIELFIGSTASSGTFTVEGKLIGSEGAGGGSTALGAMTVTAGSEDYYSVSGNTVTIKKAVAESDYKSVSFVVTGWNKNDYANVMYSVVNNLNASVTVKYKVTTSTGTGWGYPDLTVAAGASNSNSFKTTTNDQTSATDVTLIEIFFITTGTGTLTLNVSLF